MWHDRASIRCLMLLLRRPSRSRRAYKPIINDLMSSRTTMTAPLDIVIMAAGKGTRMKSRHPKVLQKLAGRALLQHVLDTAAQLKARSAVVITGHGAAEVEAAIAGAQSAEAGFDLKFSRQEPQLGTGHAVLQAVPQLRTTAWWWCCPVTYL